MPVSDCFVKKAIEKYQCPGCISGSDTKCGRFEQTRKTDNVLSCSSHCAGTRGSRIGLFFLGMPRGFTRAGFEEHNLKIDMFESISKWRGYDLFNVPTWKWRNDKGHVFVRGQHPKKNMGFLHIFLNDEGYGKINCHELSASNLDGMDG